MSSWKQQFYKDYQALTSDGLIANPDDIIELISTIEAEARSDERKKFFTGKPILHIEEKQQ